MRTEIETKVPVEDGVDKYRPVEVINCDLCDDLISEQQTLHSSLGDEFCPTCFAEGKVEKFYKSICAGEDFDAIYQPIVEQYYSFKK